MDDPPLDPNVAASPAWPDTLPGIELAEGLSRLEGRKELYRRMLEELQHQLQGALTEMPRLLAAASWTEARRLAHLLRGGAANLGATGVAAEMMALEFEVRKTPPERVAEVWARTEAAVAVFLESLGQMPRPAHAVQRALNRAEVAAHLEELEGMLRTNDLNALEAWAQLAPRLSPHVAAEAIQRITNRIERIEFDLAALEVAALREAPSAAPQAAS